MLFLQPDPLLTGNQNWPQNLTFADIIDIVQVINQPKKCSSYLMLIYLGYLHNINWLLFQPSTNKQGSSWCHNSFSLSSGCRLPQTFYLWFSNHGCVLLGSTWVSRTKWTTWNSRSCWEDWSSWTDWNGWPSGRCHFFSTSSQDLQSC